MHAGNDDNIVINPQPEGDFVEFLDITEFPGVAELDRDVLDGASEAIIIPNGLWFGQDIVTEAFVSHACQPKYTTASANPITLIPYNFYNCLIR